MHHTDTGYHLKTDERDKKNTLLVCAQKINFLELLHVSWSDVFPLDLIVILFYQYIYNTIYTHCC